MEQRRHRPRGAVRAVLHPAAARRLDRHRQSRASERAVSGHPPVLGLRGRQRDGVRCAGLPESSSARQLRAGRRARGLSAPASARRLPTIRCSRATNGSRAPTNSPAGCRTWPPNATSQNPSRLHWAAEGTDVDFGALSRQLIGYGVRNGTTALFGHEVRNLNRQRDGSWAVTVRNRRTGENHTLSAAFVFVGAGGGHCPCCRSQASKKSRGLVVSRSADGSCAAATRRSPARHRPRSTACRRRARRG